MTVLHATEPATPYLSLFARVDAFTRADLDGALFESRSLVKQLAMRRAVSDLSAVQVRLERDQTGWVLPDDVDPEPPVEPWAALLPALDPTALGWKERDFYLAPDFYPAIFDWSGNCGTTVWWAGRIIGTYVQDDAG